MDRTPESLGLGETIVRYFSFAWLFQDAATGDLWQRNAALRFNLLQRRFLPIYMLRWSILFGIAMLLGETFEQAVGALIPAVIFFMAAALSLSYLLVAFAVWLVLRLADL
jgi:hypothetical protein